MAQIKFPYTVGRSEIKRIVHACRQPHQRIGQAVCNKYDIPKDLEDKIYESDNFEQVVQYIYNHFHRADYQNLEHADQ